MELNFTPTCLAYSPKTNKLYIGNPTAGQVYVYDAATYLWIGQLYQSYPFGEKQIGVDTETGRVYGTWNDTLYVYSGDDDQEITRYGFSSDLVGLDVDSANHLVYVINDQDQIIVYDGMANDLLSGYIGVRGTQGVTNNPNFKQFVLVNYDGVDSFIENYDVQSEQLVNSVGWQAEMLNPKIDPRTNELYLYNITNGAVDVFRSMEDGSGSQIAEIPISNEVHDFAFLHQETCEPGGSGCNGIFVAGDTSGQYVFQFGGFVGFDTTEIELGANVSQISTEAFRINTTGVYEISVRIPLRSSNGNYTFRYAVQVNGSAIFTDEHNGSGASGLWVSSSQSFRKLNAGDEITVWITEYFNGDEFADTFENLQIAIRKIC